MKTTTNLRHLNCAFYTRKSTEEGPRSRVDSLNPKEIDRREWRNKRSITKKGKERGGRHFDKSSLFKLLTNMAYIAKIRYKEEVHNGEHEPIVPVEVWDRVQKLLKHNGKTGGIAVRNKFGALLKGIVRCVCCDAAHPAM